MGLLNSEKLLDVLLQQKVITKEQHQKVITDRTKVRARLIQKKGLRRQSDRQEWDKDYPDMLDIILAMSLDFEPIAGLKLTEELIIRAVGKEYKIPFKRLDSLSMDMDVVTGNIPRSFAINHLLVPISKKGDILQVALCDPDKSSYFLDLEKVNRVKITPCIATRSEIKRIIGEFFGFRRSIAAAESQFNEQRSENTLDIGNLEQYVKLSSAKELASTDQHIKAAVNHLFSYALEQRASDIHIEPKKEICLVRFRIDGTLHSLYNLPKAVHPAITSRIKTLARMDISEKRRPQDGRIKISRPGGKEVELRVSTVPVAFGEKTVLRLLDPEMMFQDIDSLGFSQRDRQIFDGCVQSPHGIFLVTGPTGSGKSTTLYSTLKAITTSESNVITVEDPVEMVHEDFNQISIQPQIEVTFGSILRNILRQDPDIIMIGEIRDLETAAHAAQAAMTGHMVFSTLHTNDAVASITRLRDLGLDPFLISATVLGTMAQRLVRKICKHCREPYQVPISDLKKLGMPVEGEGEITLYKGKGCRKCRKTGYLGRLAIFEIFAMTDNLKEMINSDADVVELRKEAAKDGMTSLRQDCWRKVMAGLTTVEETIRVTGA